MFSKEAEHGAILGAAPWDGMERMWEQSPMKHAPQAWFDRYLKPAISIHHDSSIKKRMMKTMKLGILH